MDEQEIKKHLEECANEPIQFLKSIQYYGKLIAADARNLTIKVISENHKELKDSNPFQKTLNDFFSPSDIENINHFIEDNKFISDYPLNLTYKKTNQTYLFHLYKMNDLIVLEEESGNEDYKKFPKEYLVNSLTNVHLVDGKEESIYHYAEQVATKIKEATSYDRVMVYKFHEDYHGEVIGEAKEEHLSPYLGMHFPESDIPSQARSLYIRNLVRIITDVDAEPIKLISDDYDLNQFDLSDSILRHVSPIHIQYLKNMGVNASLSLSIIVDGKLWGLVSCHHYQGPKFISQHDRAFLKLVTFGISAQISRASGLIITERLNLVKHLNISLVDHLSNHSDNAHENSLNEVLKFFKYEILKLLNASGFLLIAGKNMNIVGKVPPQNIIKKIKEKVEELDPLDTYTNNHLSDEFTEIEESEKDFAGAIAVGSVSKKINCIIMWFRKPRETEIRWAGKNEKNIEVKNGITRLSPRGSFEEITKIEKGRSLGFSDADKKVANEFLWFVNRIILDQLRISEDANTYLLKEAERKNIFISNLSHELRTPLNNILGWLQLYQNEMKQNNKLKELAQIINDNAYQQLNLVNDLLDSSKLSLGKIKLNLVNRNICDVITEVANYFLPTFKTKNIECSINYVNSKIHCLIDEVRFEQVLRNIIQNAVKFSHKGGLIGISIRENKTDAIIEIKDNGIGIDKKSLINIFKQFFQEDSNKSRSNKGLGLGLALTKQIVELHGGQISIDSEGKNQGTTVAVTLPITDGPLQEQSDSNTLQNQPIEKLPLQNKKILLLEDTIESARFVTMYLEKAGATVTWVENASIALTILESQFKYDMVISDIGLPEMDGHDFVKLAKQIESYKETPFIALSAYGSIEEIKKSLASGFSKHIVKTVQLDELLTDILDIIV